MIRGLSLAFALVAATGWAYDSRCYEGGDACHDGPRSARARWIGPSDEHRQLWERTVLLSGVPPGLASGEFTLRVFAADAIVPDGTGSSVATVTPVRFADAERVRSRTMTPSEFAQLPDFGFALWDWATGFETCPLDPVLAAPAPLDACHEFKTHMGAVNSNHFLPQAQAFYAYYHQLALGRAATCKTMKDRIVARGGDVGALVSFIEACEREAFVLEAIGHHFLQDAWATGHMWERWGSPDLLDYTDLPQSLLIAMTSGLVHGARGVLQDAIGFAGFDVNDPLCAPGAPVRFVPAPIAASVAGLGDLYLGDLLAGDGAAFPAQYFQLFSCAATSLRQVHLAMGGTPGPLDPALIEIADPTGTDCFGQRVTDAAMAAGIGLDMTSPVGTPIRIELDSQQATQLVPLASAFIGSDPQNVNPLLAAGYAFDLSAIVSHARIQAAAHPEDVDLASGGLGTLLGIDRNAAYVRVPLAPYVDPPLPWPNTPTAANDAANRAVALARAFHEAHAIDWCNRFHLGAPDGSDVELLRAHVHVLQTSGIVGEDLDAACDTCETFVSRHLRVGTDEAHYDTAREPLCRFLADDPAAVQYVFQPGSPDDGVSALAAGYCGCASTTTTTVTTPTTTTTTLGCGYGAGAVPDGSYILTCTGCAVNGPMLSCDCLNFQKLPVHTSIDITGCRTDPKDPMANLNGVLTCKSCAAKGACCLPGASCTDGTTFAACHDVGDFQGENSMCSTADCASPRGACCHQDDSCSDFTSGVSCHDVGDFQGQGSACDALDCAARGACCLPQGACSDETSFLCQSEGIFQGTGSDCGEADCSPHGACCFPDASCIDDVSATACGSVGEFQGEGTACATTTCAPPPGIGLGPVTRESAVVSTRR